MMTKSTEYFNLRQALSEPGCALCRLLAQTADSYLNSQLWELVNDEELRLELRQTRGYCRDHAWLLVRHGASLGAAIMMKDIIDTVLRIAQLAEFKPASSLSLRQVWQKFNADQPSKTTVKLAGDLAPEAPCPVCLKVETSEAYYLKTLLKHLAEPDDLASVYRNSGGLCLPHFQSALAHVSKADTFALLVEAQKTVWQRLSGELGEFIRKKDHRFQHEEFGPEGDSWLRAIEAVSGAPPPKPKM